MLVTFFISCTNGKVDEQIVVIKVQNSTGEQAITVEIDKSGIGEGPTNRLNFTFHSLDDLNSEVMQ